jgi:hypothetical protein
MRDSQKPWSYEVDENVIVWDIKGWNDPTEEELEAVTKELQSVARRDSITASVTEMEADVTLDTETMAYIEQNNTMYSKLGVSKVGWVSDGIQGMALKSKLQGTSGVEVEAFNELDEAVSWAKV